MTANADYRDRMEVILLWLFPVTYFLHIAEEYWAGVALATSPNKIRGANMTATQFLIVNAVAWLLLTTGTILSQRFRFRQWWLVCLGTVVMINGLFHLVGTLRISAYNPGLVSGVLIWIPLGVFALIGLKKRMLPNKYWTALIIGLLINGAVLFLARGGRKLFEG